MMQRGESSQAFEKVAGKLINGKSLGAKHKDHALKGEFKGSRNCHIEPDWILIYTKRGKGKEEALIFERTGTHSDLFK